MKKLIIFFVFLLLAHGVLAELPSRTGAELKDWVYNNSLAILGHGNAVDEDNSTYGITLDTFGNPAYSFGDFGRGNKTLTFDGNDILNISGGQEQFSTIMNFTVLWCMDTGISASKAIITRATNGGSGDGLWKCSIETGIRCAYVSAGGASIDARAPKGNGDAFGDECFAFVVNVTSNTITAQLLVNGSSDKMTLESAGNTWAAQNPADDITIGYDAAQGGYWLTGDLYYISIINKTMTTDEVKEYHNSPDFEIEENAPAPSAAPPDTTPPVITLNSPDNNSRNNTIPFIFNLSVSDDSGNPIICVLRNTTDIFNETTSAQNIDFNMAYNTSETSLSQQFDFNITCFDNVEPANSSKTELLNITIDNILPEITITTPLNNSIIDKFTGNLSFNALCSDSYPLSFNISLINSSGGINDSYQNDSEINDELLIKGFFDLSAVPIGLYSLNYTCVDAHTYYGSKVTRAIKDTLLNKLYYETTTRNDISVQLIASDLALCDFGTWSASDREIFWYDFSCNAVKGQHYYTFMLRDNYGELKYLSNSDYNAHFVTQDNFITLDLDNDEKVSYEITKIGNAYRINIQTDRTWLNFKNSIGGLNKQQTFLNLEIIESIYTSMNHFDFNIPTVTIDSDVFVPILNLTVNVTDETHITFKGSGIVEKITQPQSTEVTGRLLLNDEIIFEGTLISTAGTIPFNLPIHDAELKAGQNNISVEVSESGQGAINITNFIIEGDVDESFVDNEIEHTHNNETLLFASADFLNIFNISVNRTINTSSLIDFHHRVENIPALATTITCYAENNNTGELTPSYYSYMAAAGDSGSTGVAFASRILSNTSEKWMLYCKAVNGNQLINTISAYMFLLGDNNGNIINSLQNSSTAVTTISSTETTVLNINNFRFQNSSEVDMIASISAQSTSGVHTTPMQFKINTSTLDEDDCMGESRTDFLASADARTIKIYFECEDNNRGFINFTLYAQTATGESADILNVSVSGYEVNGLPFSEQNIPPIVALTLPLNNENLRLVNEIEFMGSDVNSNEFIMNITLSNSSNTSVIAGNLPKEAANISFNFSTFTVGTYELKILIRENETADNLESFDNISINIVSVIINLTNPLNNSVKRNNPVEFKYTVDVVSNCSLFFNSVWTINQSMNASIGANSFDALTLANGTFFWSVGCVNTGIETRSETNTFLVDLSTQSFDVMTCPSTVAGMMFLVLAVAIALFFVFIALMFGIGVMGVFGSIMLIVLSLYLSPCINLFAYILALISMFLLIWFALSGLGFINKSLQ